MRNSMKPVGILLAVATILALAMGAWFLFGPGSRPRTPIPPPEKPAMIDAYDRLLTAYKAAQAGQPVDVNLDPFPEDALDIIAGYEQLFARVAQVFSRPEVERVELVLHQKPSQWSDTEQSTIAEFIAANQDLISEVRDIAERGRPIHPLDFSDIVELDMPYHLASPVMRQCAWLLRADAVLNGMKGSYADAVDDILAGMKLGDALAVEPVLFSQLIRLAMYDIIYSAVRSTTDGSDLPPDLAHRLIAHVAQADHREGLVEALRAELYIGQMRFQGIGRGEWPDPSAAAPAQPSLVDEITERLSGAFFEQRFLHANQESFTTVMNQLILAATLPYYDAVPVVEQVAGYIENPPHMHFLSAALLPSPDPCALQARHEAVLDLMQMGLLIEQHKAQHRSYPPTLDAIASDLGGSLPVDPFTGEEYHYRRSEGDFVLYSVGLNLVDDGGTHNFREGDIVWRGKRER